MQRVKEKDKVRRGLKAEKAIPFKEAYAMFMLSLQKRSSYLCPETMAAFASSSVKNTEDRNEVWKCLLYMSTGRSKVSKRILNTLFWLTSFCVQQGPHPT